MCDTRQRQRRRRQRLQRLRCRLRVQQEGALIVREKLRRALLGQSRAVQQLALQQRQVGLEKGDDEGAQGKIRGLLQLRVKFLNCEGGVLQQKDSQRVYFTQSQDSRLCARPEFLSTTTGHKESGNTLRKYALGNTCSGQPA